MLRKLSFLIAGLLFIINNLSAQNIDSVLSIYGSNYQQEKLHIHFDKSIYNQGETVWFKAYLLAGAAPSVFSKNVYVDFFDAEGNLLQHITSPLFESSAKGQFDIPAKYSGQTLHVRAYTQWMLNFDSAFLFNKNIRISQLTHSTLVQEIKASIQFFPEGGELITGLPSNLAFMAINQWGKPVKVKGSVKNSKNELIDSLITQHDGMGVFKIEPKANEKYTCTWTDESGHKHTTPLPVARNTGITLQVSEEPENVVFTVQRRKDAADNFKQLNVVAVTQQQEVYRSKINLVKEAVTAKIPVENLPTGVLTITVFDANWVPVAERVAFVNTYQYDFDPDVRILNKGLGKRGKNKIEIHISDTIRSNMSVAVTDADLYNDSSSNIISNLLLAGDIKGYIHNPAYYFSGTADSISRHMDLVMLTHGWRRFKWDDLLQWKMPVTIYPKENEYLQLKGKVYGEDYLHLRGTKNITIFIQGKDSSKHFSFLPIAADGTFKQPAAVFFDTMKIYYQLSGDKMLTSKAVVHIQNGLLQPLNFSIPTGMNTFLPQDELSLLRSRYFYDEKERLNKLAETATLKEVIVTTRAKNPAEILDKKYTSGLFSGGDGYQFDVATDPVAQSSLSVFDYLQGRVAGLQINTNGNPPSLQWRGGSPDLYLDEMKGDADMIKNIPMTDVAYIKVFRPPFFGSMGGGAGGAIAVYTRKGSDTRTVSKPGEGMEHTLFMGYTPYKEFYNPDYSTQPDSFLPDVRTTLYWNPFVLTDKRNKTVWIDFYNNDISKKLRVIIEGMNSDGKLMRVEKIIQ